MTPTLPTILALLSSLIQSVAYECFPDQIEQYLFVQTTDPQRMSRKEQESRLRGPGRAFPGHPQGIAGQLLLKHAVAPPEGT